MSVYAFGVVSMNVHVHLRVCACACVLVRACMRVCVTSLHVAAPCAGGREELVHPPAQPDGSSRPALRPRHPVRCAPPAPPRERWSARGGSEGCRLAPRRGDIPPLALRGGTTSPGSEPPLLSGRIIIVIIVVVLWSVLPPQRTAEFLLIDWNRSAPTHGPLPAPLRVHYG